MTETLLSPSSILLFGRVVEDLQIVVPTRKLRAYFTADYTITKNINVKADFKNGKVGNISVKKSDILFVKAQNILTENGLYRINTRKDSNGDEYFVLKLRIGPPVQPSAAVWIKAGKTNSEEYFSLHSDGSVIVRGADDFDEPNPRHSPFRKNRKGLRSQIEGQLLGGEKDQNDQKPKFSRIYGFSYEGVYYDLARPVLFLVHGEGYPASELTGNKPNRARAPGDPSLIGTGTTDFQYAEDIMVWSYDQADYTIRMDVQSGMFEQVLLDAVLGGSPSADVSGMNARGMNARGMNARGMNARGMNARGMNARGGNSD